MQAILLSSSLSKATMEIVNVLSKKKNYGNCKLTKPVVRAMLCGIYADLISWQIIKPSHAHT